MPNSMIPDVSDCRLEFVGVEVSCIVREVSAKSKLWERGLYNQGL